MNMGGQLFGLFDWLVFPQLPYLLHAGLCDAYIVANDVAEPLDLILEPLDILLTACFDACVSDAQAALFLSAIARVLLPTHLL